MSQLNKLIDTIIKDRMLTCQCTDDVRVCMRCQYDACRPKETVSEPTFERVPEGVLLKVKYSNKIFYPFGNKQLIFWDCDSYCVIRNICADQVISISPYLIPSTFGELKPGEWFREIDRNIIGMVINKEEGVFVRPVDNGIVEDSHSEDWKVLRVSEVMP